MKSVTERLMAKGLTRYESVMIACAIEHATNCDSFDKSYGRLMANDLREYAKPDYDAQVIASRITL